MRPGGEHPRRRRAPQHAVRAALALAALATGAAPPLTAAQEPALRDSAERITGKGSSR
jgi:hypothetical protein